MHAAAIDLGGTKLAGAVFDDDGNIVEREVIPVAGEGAAVGHLIAQLAARLAAHTEVDALGVSVPGIYRHERGTVWAPNIGGWDDYPLQAELSAHVDVPVRIASDRTCYILGEVWQGNARGTRNAIFVAVGTGIGLGILADGNIIHGQHDIAGATGWLALSEEYKPEYASCGDFEYHAAGPGIARAAGVEDAQAAFAAMERGDATARAAIQTAVAYWGRAAANYVSLFNPEVVVFGGGVFGPAARFIDDIYAEALKWAQPISIRQVRFTATAIGADAGLYGAAAVARRSHGL